MVTQKTVLSKVEKNLTNRLQAGVQAWTDALEGKKNEIDLSMDTDAPTQPTHKPGGDPQVIQIVLINLNSVCDHLKCNFPKIKCYFNN